MSVSETLRKRSIKNLTVNAENEKVSAALLLESDRFLGILECQPSILHYQPLWSRRSVDYKRPPKRSMHFKFNIFSTSAGACEKVSSKTLHCTGTTMDEDHNLLFVIIFSDSDVMMVSETTHFFMRVKNLDDCLYHSEQIQISPGKLKRLAQMASRSIIQRSEGAIYRNVRDFIYEVLTSMSDSVICDPGSWSDPESGAIYEMASHNTIISGEIKPRTISSVPSVRIKKQGQSSTDDSEERNPFEAFNQRLGFF